MQKRWSCVFETDCLKECNSAVFRRKSVDHAVKGLYGVASDTTRRLAALSTLRAVPQTVHATFAGKGNGKKLKIRKKI
jgi:hypothetical protein